MAGNEDFVRPEIKVDEESLKENYVRFVAEPLEPGYGHTLANALRRVLLSSMPGVAVTAIRIDGAVHEFCSVPDVVEDVMEIVLNIKKLKFNCTGTLPRTLELRANEAGAVTAANIVEDSSVEVLNKDQVICTLDKAREFHMELEIDRGVGDRPSEENKREDQPIGTIPVDSLFSPVERVRYDVSTCRVGQRIDYDKMEMEIWTDCRILPLEALNRASMILRDLFSTCIQENVGSNNGPALFADLNPEESELVQRLKKTVDTLELSNRAKNCLKGEDIRYLAQLVDKSESELNGIRGFGSTSLAEIKGKLEEAGLSLEMNLSGNVRVALANELNYKSTED